MKQSAEETVTALATGDFTDLADRFANAGMSVRMPSRGILQLFASAGMGSRPRILLSVGVHGDETAPLEMLGHILHEFAGAPRRLGVDLMIVVGNLAAVAAGKRYIDADLNRLFRVERADLQGTAEAERADQIMRATASFFSTPDADKWHLDLHTAIRASHYSTFAVVPAGIPERNRDALLGWLGKAAIEAVILSPSSAGTYSAYTAERHGASSATLELGQVAALGSNDLSRFADTATALTRFLSSGIPDNASSPAIFRVKQELIKRSDAFSMSFDQNTKNFTPLQPGELIARDTGIEYTVGEATEYVVFPNPSVRAGFRAGLMVVRES
ncbi:succinylglutamate desuccinylase [Noviherbaspirillum sp. Root189]|uniref:succinylglutamate desuccinylase n=1 Tax=Noviherbaspirillum sp. Root189 TaxID=1736487 RepID=UPI00070B25B8|nr:succinylglutamate desuccinylase [Noviherbaspirillum sp. Root189]KRB89199.1 succinylglutamate desuccinylase [Noviherbaspirillum sp. Root189]